MQRERIYLVNCFLSELQWASNYEWLIWIQPILMCVRRQSAWIGKRLRMRTGWKPLVLAGLGTPVTRKWHMFQSKSKRNIIELITAIHSYHVLQDKHARTFRPGQWLKLPWLSWITHQICMTFLFISTKTWPDEGMRESIDAYELTFLLIGCKTFLYLRLAQKGKNKTQRRSSEERMREWNRVPRWLEYSTACWNEHFAIF